MPAIDTRIFAKPGTRHPNRISDAIRSLCSEISPRHEPVFLDVRPEPDAQPIECFHNVNAKVARDGGSILYGWAIWEWPRVFVEAEHHAVWTDGRVTLDVTPHVPATTRILFLPDPTKVYDYEGNRRAINVKRATGKSPAVQRWLAADDRLHRYIEDSSIGRLATMDAVTYERLKGDKRRFHVEILLDLARTTGRNDPCFCQSGLKFKKCCEPLIDLHV